MQIYGQSTKQIIKIKQNIAEKNPFCSIEQVDKRNVIICLPEIPLHRIDCLYGIHSDLASLMMSNGGRNYDQQVLLELKF